MKQKLSVFALIFGMFAFSSCEKSPITKSDAEDIGPPTWPERVPKKVDFVKHVRPLLVVNCTECHNSRDASKYMGLNLQTKKGAFTTGVHAPVIVPGQPDNSLLIKMLIKDPAHHWAMPPTPDRFSGARLEVLRKWIKDGAEWPDGVVLEHPADVVEW